MHEPSQVSPDNEAADVRLWQRWRQGERPDLEAFLARLRTAGREDHADQVDRH